MCLPWILHLSRDVGSNFESLTFSEYRQLTLLAHGDNVGPKIYWSITMTENNGVHKRLCELLVIYYADQFDLNFGSFDLLCILEFLLGGAPTLSVPRPLLWKGLILPWFRTPSSDFRSKTTSKAASFSLNLPAFPFPLPFPSPSHMWLMHRLKTDGY